MPRLIFLVSILLAVLVLIEGILGISFSQRLYSRESHNWYIQSVGQDWLNLILIVPALSATAFFAFYKNKSMILVWAGLVAYLVYSFVIYCFDVHFNQLFILYCLVLGISVYLFAWFIISSFKSQDDTWRLPSRMNKFIGLYLVIFGLLFAGLWLMQIIPAQTRNEFPAAVADSGLPTNPVHVLDLSMVLPGIIFTGIGLLRRTQFAIWMTPVILSFLVAMDLTIAGLSLFLYSGGLQDSPSLAIVMIALAGFTTTLLILSLRTILPKG